MSDLLRYSSHSECSICLLEFPKNTHIGVKTLSCNHKFHLDCINNWICNYNNSNCPICWRDDIDLEIQPVSEKQPLMFETPYGCSKGAAEQYCLDYWRIYKLPTTVFRMSCIYGNRQMGESDQGWLCHFARNIDRPITVYGDGSQVRDALYIDDYVDLCIMIVENKDKVKGEVYNIGGGPNNTISVNEALKKLGNENISYSDWRPSDQRYYVSDLTKIKADLGWQPTIGIAEGLDKLKIWVKSQV